MIRVYYFRLPVPPTSNRSLKDSIPGRKAELSQSTTFWYLINILIDNIINRYFSMIYKIYFPNLLWCKNSLILENKSFKNARSLKPSDVFTLYKLFYYPSWRGFSSSRDEWANKFPGLTKPWPTFSSDRAAITLRYASGWHNARGKWRKNRQHCNEPNHILFLRFWYQW